MEKIEGLSSYQIIEPLLEISFELKESLEV